ncbi:MAG TPA: ECF-type sigma factor [Candidatus Limnocylindrales bacterium]|nr:ECF-type sigma factor [Candidatus Limnocylindrales bacterium]
MQNEPVSELLIKWRKGDREALDRLIPIVYRELREIAHRFLGRERPDHTLRSTALVHEAYLRLVQQGPVEAENRAHFVGVAACLMRQILVDYARGHAAAKRDAGFKVEFDEAMAIARVRIVDVIALDDALKALARIDAQQGQIVELRFFGGLTTEETAEVLRISPTTVKRDWNVAKAWLTREMTRGNRGTARKLGKN